MTADERWHRLRGAVAVSIPYALTLILAVPLLGQRAVDAAGGLTAFGLAAGLLGITGFAVNIFLGARLPAVPRLMGGLELLYATHRMNGRVAYLLVAIHVLAISGGLAMRSLDSVLRIFTFDAGGVIALGLLAFLGMTAAIAATLYARLTHEAFIYVQRSFGLVFILGALHAFMTPGIKAASQPLTVYLGLLCTGALAAFIYRSLLGDLLVRRFDYVVTKVIELDPSVVEIHMDPIDRPLLARPGQFVFVTFYSDSFDSRFHPVTLSSEGESAVVVLRPGDARHQFHPFSLTSPAHASHLSLVIKALGDFTTALHGLEPGARARVEGPYGEFSHLNVRSRRQVWIAGGIGITPFLSMARSLTDASFEITLFWGVKHSSEAFFKDELEDIAARLGTFSFHLVSEEESGHISAALVSEHVVLAGVEILIVGPPPMERALRSQLQAAGVPPDRIHSERFAFGPPERVGARAT